MTATAMAQAFEEAARCAGDHITVAEFQPQGKRQILFLTRLNEVATTSIAVDTKSGRRFLGKPRTWHGKNDVFFAKLAERVLR